MRRHYHFIVAVLVVVCLLGTGCASSQTKQMKSQSLSPAEQVVDNFMNMILGTRSYKKAYQLLSPAVQKQIPRDDFRAVCRAVFTRPDFSGGQYLLDPAYARIVEVIDVLYKPAKDRISWHIKKGNIEKNTGVVLLIVTMPDVKKMSRAEYKKLLDDYRTMITMEDNETRKKMARELVERPPLGDFKNKVKVLKNQKVWKIDTIPFEFLPDLRKVMLPIFMD